MSGLKTDSELTYLARIGAGAMMRVNARSRKGLGRVVVGDKKDEWETEGEQPFGRH